MNVLMFLTLRAAHVLLAALWIGGSVFGSLMLMPAIMASGPSGGQVMVAMNRRGLGRYMAVLGMTTVLTGVYLLWRFTGGFDPAVAATHAGLSFSIGGAAGILAAVIGGAVVGRSAQQLDGLASQAIAMADGPAKGTLFQQAAMVRQRMKRGSLVVIGLQATALVCMALGHYV
jgi:hypothetical protein